MGPIGENLTKQCDSVHSLPFTFISNVLGFELGSLAGIVTKAKLKVTLELSLLKLLCEQAKTYLAVGLGQRSPSWFLLVPHLLFFHYFATILPLFCHH